MGKKPTNALLLSLKVEKTDFGKGLIVSPLTG
jgi:hypothetical protein